MQAISNVTNLSNWTLSFVLGAAAALKSGAHGGVPGELPMSDTMLGLTSHQLRNGAYGDNLFIGIDTQWARMMLKTFESRRMQFSYLLIKESKTKRCPDCAERCPMVVHPMNTAGEPASDTQQTQLPTAKSHPDEVPAGPDPILPNMYYSLVTDYMDFDTDDKGRSKRVWYKVVHKPSCILSLTIDKRATEFLSETLSGRLSSMDNKAALDWCWSIIDDMCDQVLNCKVANEWDCRIINRIKDLLKYPDSAEQSDVYLNESMDRIHSRITGMLERLGLSTFTTRLENVKDTYTINDVRTCFVIYFGIRRAITMSGRIYNENALVFMGYNINLGHEIVRDLTEIQSQSAVGYSSRLVVESTACGRVVDRINEPSHVFRLAVILDTMLSIGILTLSHIGPVLSMYTARRMTAPYRESYMRMGTSMRWSVLQVSLLHSGTARDDWMVCIKPDKRWRLALFFFIFWSFISSIGSVIFWPLISHSPVAPVSEFGLLVCILSCAIGVPWVVLAMSVKHQAAKQCKSNLEAWVRIIFHPHTIINTGLVIVLVTLVSLDITIDWIYLYLLEALYFAQWLYGEASCNWVYQSTALFMLGALGAFRLSNVADDNN